MVVYLPMRTYGVNRHFDLLKAFGVIERVSLKHFFSSEKTYFTTYVRNMF